MKTKDINFSNKNLARLTGLFYFLIIFAGLFSGMVVRGNLIDPTNADLTLNNIIQNESMFRLGFLGDLLMVISDVVVSLLFYYLLRSVNKTVAVFAAGFRLLQSAILGANLINLFKPILMIQGAGQLPPAELDALANDMMLQMQTFDYGYLISGVFFGINCLLMGYLLFKADFFPVLLGIMMTVAGFGYLFNCVANFAVPSLIEISEMGMLFTAVISELALCLFLIIKGINSTREANLAFA